MHSWQNYRATADPYIVSEDRRTCLNLDTGLQCVIVRVPNRRQFRNVATTSDLNSRRRHNRRTPIYEHPITDHELATRGGPKLDAAEDAAKDKMIADRHFAPRDESRILAAQRRDASGPSERTEVRRKGNVSERIYGERAPNLQLG
jgi:hypothetical protein